jgi:predicted DCC family thiol-disulfide oxidoreductase YuxK
MDARGAAGRAHERILIYDGDCPFCTRLSALGVRLGLYPASSRVAYQELAGELAARLADAGIAERVLVLDRRTGELRGGLSGLLWLADGTPLARLARPLGRAPFVGLLDGLYRFVSANRRFLAAPRKPVPQCACEPREEPALRRIFLGLALLAGAVPLVVLGTAAVGPAPRALVPPIALFGPLLALALLAGRLPLELRPRARTHFAACAAVQGLAFLPLALAMLVADLPTGGLRIALGLTCLAAGFLGHAMQRRRARYLGLGLGWLRAWQLSSLSGLALLFVAAGRLASAD